MARRGRPPGSPKTPGSGRQKGTPNKLRAPKIKERIAAAQAAALDHIEGMVQRMTPLEKMLEMMNDPDNPPGLVLEAAKAAAPYVHAKKPDLMVVARKLSDLSVEELTELSAILAREDEAESESEGIH
jgi:hypothetical protein